MIDLEAVRHRRNRVRSEMAARDIAAVVLVDPVNDMQVCTSRRPARYLFLPPDGPVILFEFSGAKHLARELITVDEVRTATTASFVAAGRNSRWTRRRDDDGAVGRARRRSHAHGGAGACSGPLSRA